MLCLSLGFLLAFSGLAGIINFYLEPENIEKIKRKSPFFSDLLFFIKWRELGRRAGACSWPSLAHCTLYPCEVRPG